MYLNLEDRCP